MAALTEDVARARELIVRARRIAVLTGAGISAESGIPTFRDPGGLWKTYRPEDLATPEAFARDPRLVWEFYQTRRRLIAAARPNEAHRALARLERVKPATVVVTQNVDGLHQAAGSQNLLELHGNLWYVRCTGCRTVTEARGELPSLPPCGRCGALLRPHVVWFGEPLDPTILERAQAIVREAEALLVVGTSGIVYPAAGLVSEATGRGAVVIEVNPEATPLSEIATVVVRGNAAVSLPQLIV